jgi:adenylylsulfate kinase-like enzyme
VGVLLTGVYGSGRSSGAEEIAYLLEQQGEPCALPDLDYRADECGLTLQNLAAVGANF